MIYMYNGSVYAVRRITGLRHFLKVRMLSNAPCVLIYVAHIMFKLINKKFPSARKNRSQ